MSTEQEEQQIQWFATKIVDNRLYVLKYLEKSKMETVRINDVPSLLFVKCTSQQICDLRYGDFKGYIYIYRKAGSYEPEPVPERVMNTFKILAPFHDEPVMYLAVDDPHFFEGKRKRVISGIFKGCEGVVKRIKGERRLIVRVSEKSAVATPYIPKEALEDIDD